VPWLARAQASRRKLTLERAGALAGLALMLLLPAVSVGLSGLAPLMHAWRDALVSRGLPYESHNQSFAALLHRWLSGAPVHVVSLGMNPVPMGWQLLHEETIRLLSFAWVCLSGGALLAWLMLRSAKVPASRWIAVMVALLVLPSHLVWKPYFALFLPVAALATGRIGRVSEARHAWLAVGFAAMNLTGFDLLGPDWGARAEAASSMLWAGLAYLAF
jgi:hypothetical protein